MFHITDFFKKFSKLAPPEAHIKNALKKIISERVGTEISLDSIKISGGGEKGSVVYLNCHPALKSEIFLHKQDILADLKAALGNKAPKDVR